MDGVLTVSARATLALIAAALAAALACAPAAWAAPAAQSPGAVRDYWTMSRMLAAEQMPVSATEVPAPVGAAGYDPAAAAYVPADGAPAALRSGTPSRPDQAGDSDVDRREVTDPAAAEVRMHGKVFFTVASGPAAGDRVCSGTVVNGKNRSVVWTAGHCVFDPDGGGFASNWLFVPAFSESGAPYGEWPAKRLLTTPGWKRAASFRYDLGAAVVTKNEEGERLQDVVGARGIGFDQPRDQRYSAYGYPAEGNSEEFTGAREYRCVSATAGADAPLGPGPSTLAIGCDMLGGASGGGWVATKTLLSVTSYGYLHQPNLLYGPYMSKRAKALYRKASGYRRKCGCGRRRP